MIVVSRRWLGSSFKNPAKTRGKIAAIAAIALLASGYAVDVAAAEVHEEPQEVVEELVSPSDLTGGDEVDLATESSFNDGISDGTGPNVVSITETDFKDSDLVAGAMDLVPSSPLGLLPPELGQLSELTQLPDDELIGFAALALEPSNFPVLLAETPNMTTVSVLHGTDPADATPKQDDILEYIIGVFDVASGPKAGQWVEIALEMGHKNGSFATILELRIDPSQQSPGDIQVLIQRHGSTEDMGASLRVRQPDGSWSAPSALNFNPNVVLGSVDGTTWRLAANFSALFMQSEVPDACLAAFGGMFVFTYQTGGWFNPIPGNDKTYKDMIDDSIMIQSKAECEATVTVVKYEAPVGFVGNNPAGLPLGAGWEFTIAPSSPLSLETNAEAVTGADGRVSWTLSTSSKTNPGSVAVTELLQPGWTLKSVECKDADGALRSVTTNAATFTVSGIKRDDVVACAVINLAPPTLQLGDVTVKAAATRTFEWELAKQVSTDGGQTWLDEATVMARPNVDVVFDYRVVAQASATTSDADVTGSIVITNPASIPQSLSGLTITIGGVPATFVNPGSLAAGGSAIIEFSVTLPSPAEGAEVVVMLGDATVTTTVPTGVVVDHNRYATLTDTYPEFGTPRELDGIEIAAAGETVVYKATRASDERGDCDYFTNTASLIFASAAIDNLTAPVTVSICTGQDLAVVKGVNPTAMRTYGWDIVKQVVGEAEKYADINQQATFDYLVTVTPKDYTDSGWEMSGSILVTNPNDVDVVVGITDTPLLGSASGICVIPDGATQTIPAKTVDYEIQYTCLITGAQSLIIVQNMVTISWDADAVHSENAEARFTAEANWAFGYTHDVVTVVDNSASPGDLSDDIVLGTAEWNVEGVPTTFEYSITVPGPTLPSLSIEHRNTATIAETKQFATADVTVAALPLIPSVDIEASYEVIFDWMLQKSVNTDYQRVVSGNDAEFAYTVTVGASSSSRNYQAEGIVTLTNPNAFAHKPAGVTIYLNGEPFVLEGDFTAIPAGGSATYRWTLYASDSAPRLLPTITASVQGGAQSSAVVDFGDITPAESNRFADFRDTFDESNGLTATVLDARDLVAGDDDDTGATTEFEYTAARGAELKPGDCGTYVNTAKLFDEDGNPLVADATVPVEVCTGQNLTIGKSVITSLTRTYRWSIDKQLAAGDTSIKPVGDDGSAVFDYVVTVTAEPYSESGWAMQGTIVVGNPNDWPVTVSVTDLPGLGNDVSCTVEGGDSVVLKANTARKPLDYKCDFSANYDGILDGFNAATVVWDQAEASSPGYSANAIVAIRRDAWNLNPMNQKITLVDDWAVPGERVFVRELDWFAVNANPGLGVFPYRLNLAGPIENGTAEYTNTACIELSDTQGIECDTVNVEVWAYDLALRTWTAEILHNGELAHARHVQHNATHAHRNTLVPATEHGPESPIMYSTFDDPETNLEVGDTVMMAVRLFNHGDHLARVTEITAYLPDAAVLVSAPIGAAARHDVPNWQLIDGNAVAQLAVPIVLAPGQAAEIALPLLVTDNGMGPGAIHNMVDGPDDPYQDGQVHIDMAVFAEITGFEGWLPSVTPNVSTAAMALGAWAEVLDVDSVPANNAAGDPFHVDNAILNEGGDEDDHDGEVLRVLMPLAPTVSASATATYSVTHKWAIDKSVDNADQSGPLGGNGTYNYRVVVDAKATLGDLVVNGSVALSNTSDVEEPLGTNSAVAVVVGGKQVSVRLPNGVSAIAAHSSITVPFSVTLAANGREWASQLPISVTAKLTGVAACDAAAELEAATGEHYCDTVSALTSAVEKATGATAVVSDTFPEFAVKYTAANRTLSLNGARSGHWEFSYTALRGSEAIVATAYTNMVGLSTGPTDQVTVIYRPLSDPPPVITPEEIPPVIVRQVVRRTPVLPTTSARAPRLLTTGQRVPRGAPKLPLTGADILGVAGLAVLSLTGGGWLLVSKRRDRGEDEA